MSDRADAGAVNSPAAVVALNGRLDSELRALIASVSDADLPRRAGDDEWTVAQQLGHLGEFPSFFAAQLRAWQADSSTIVGRTHEHAGRLDAVRMSGVSHVAALQEGADRALQDLADALANLADDDCRRKMRNVKYGEELVSAFLDRYVFEHKRGHIAQLRVTLS